MTGMLRVADAGIDRSERQLIAFRAPKETLQTVQHAGHSVGCDVLSDRGSWVWGSVMAATKPWIGVEVETQLFEILAHSIRLPVHTEHWCSCEPQPCRTAACSDGIDPAGLWVVGGGAVPLDL
jgi:hypothetical protein